MKYNFPVQQPLQLHGVNTNDLESDLDAINAKYQLQEIGLSLKKPLYFFGSIESTKDVSSFIRKQMAEYLDLQEIFIALFLNTDHKITGYYHHSTGTLTSTEVDISLLCAAAVRCKASHVIIAHNHPGSSTEPSDADKDTTRVIKRALNTLRINLIDHQIITRYGYYSFLASKEPSLVKEGLRGFSSGNDFERELIAAIDIELEKINDTNAPCLHRQLQEPEGHAIVCIMIIRKMLADNLVIQAAIPQIESELSMI